MTPEELNRLRWNCRRGMLENDLVLERFLEKHGASLQGRRLEDFKRLLDYSDAELRKLISGRGTSTDAGIAEVVHMLQACTAREN